MDLRNGEGSGTTPDTQAQIVGIAVGSVVGCLLIILLAFFAFCYCCCCRQVD